MGVKGLILKKNIYLLFISSYIIGLKMDVKCNKIILEIYFNCYVNCVF